MQHHHPNQGGVGGGVPQSQSQVGSADYHMNYPQIREAAGVERQEVGDLGVVEAASPLRSRPPAAGGSSSGNRWPRQETLALLQIRSEMDAAFRDAAPKAPLWEQVSRRLAELGYRRSPKKCKEKFENVHKYYKRTKEGRGSRQDGKSYKFFTQLEALDHHGSLPPQEELPPLIPPPPAAGPASLLNAVGISFSSDTFSSHGGDDDDYDDEEDMEMESADVISQQRKRKRRHGSDQRMMELFEGLMNKVMEKQEHMQNKFLEVIEKREQDRMIREEAWKRQDMARLAREHELMAQERSISAARDAAIIAFLEKITGQSINLPTTMSSPNPTPPPEQSQSQSQSLHQVQEQQMQMQDISPPGGQMEAASSRWPKAEVLALIQLRSGMEFKYQDMGPKGPLWEEISAGMQKMGYNRNAKRCKEKWENINKYFKKVKDSNKKRPEDSKTCPYYHELDALYQKKVFRNISTDVIGSGTGGGGGGASSSILGSSSGQDRQLQQDIGMTSVQLPESEVEGGSKTELQTSAAGAYSSRIGSGQGDQGNAGGPKQPEDMLEKQQKQIIGDLFDMECFKTAECSYNADHDHESHTHMFQGMHETEEYSDNIHEKEFKMAYNIQLQKLNVGSSNGGQAAATSFAAMVQ